MAAPGTSDLNWPPGGTVSNLVLARLGPDGRITLLNGAGIAHVIVDVFGWYD